MQLSYPKKRPIFWNIIPTKPSTILPKHNRNQPGKKFPNPIPWKLKHHTHTKKRDLLKRGRDNQNHPEVAKETRAKEIKHLGMQRNLVSLKYQKVDEHHLDNLTQNPTLKLFSWDALARVAGPNLSPTQEWDCFHGVARANIKTNRRDANFLSKILLSDVNIYDFNWLDFSLFVFLLA